MYEIYKLYFKETPDKLYIGRTNNPKRRFNQHMWDSLHPEAKQTTYKSNWIRKHIKQGHKLYLETLFVTDCRIECSEKEAYFMHYYKEQGFTLTNTILNATLTHEGKRPFTKKAKKSMSERFGKEFTIINKVGHVFYVKSLRAWAEKSGLNYKDLHACASGKMKSSQSYKSYTKINWLSLTKEERKKEIQDFIEYDWRKENSLRIQEWGKAVSRSYLVLDKNTQSFYEILGFSQFIRERDLNVGNIFNTRFYSNRWSRGYKVFPKEMWDGFSEEQRIYFLAHLKPCEFREPPNLKVYLEKDNPERVTQTNTISINNLLDSNKRRSKKVIALDRGGNIIQEYNSLAEAKRIGKVDRSTVMRHTDNNTLDCEVNWRVV